jgi:LAS superfamily LD-carboxypeptidase LdcB
VPFIVFGGFVAVIAYVWLSNNREGEPSPADEKTFGEPLNLGEDMIVTGYIKGQKIQLQVAPIGNGYYLRIDAAHDFKKMRSACLAECGEDLPISTAFRTMEAQELLFKMLGPTVAAKPGYSNHQNGIAIDIHGLDPKKSNYSKTRDDWLTANCAQYGFERSGLNFSNKEAWHLDYVG